MPQVLGLLQILGVRARSGRFRWVGTCALALTQQVGAAQVDISGPSGSVAFGTSVTVLSNGNFVVTDPDGPGAAIGAVYLYSPSGTLISTLTGSTANDHVGGGGITVLKNGNFVVSSPNWANGAASAAGAVTWVNGSTGLSAAVSATNSLIGSKAGDNVGFSVTALNNGNYVVASPNWANGTATNAGATTWADGSKGLSGPVSATNSLVGTQSYDEVGGVNRISGGVVPFLEIIGGVIALSNCNYVVASPEWANGTATTAGAATWADGSKGLSGPVSATNSLVGTKVGDNVGSDGVGIGITALTNGNYVVASPSWGNGTAAQAGAATWADGSTGLSGIVSPTNSLVGTHSNDGVGIQVIALRNGNYVVDSSGWNNGIPLAQFGAVTWADGSKGLSGEVSAANSLVGTQASDNVGSGGVTALSNGNYVVASGYWNNEVGAATWANGNKGLSGAVSATNSLVGTTVFDNVGSGGVTALSNGNYVVDSSNWNNGVSNSQAQYGAVTWANGGIGLTGTVSAANSLIGTTLGDNVGFLGVTALSNGNYVVASPHWNAATAKDVGAVTWADGSKGLTGAVSLANSLVGTTANDVVGIPGVTALTNGNYVVASYAWNNVGAATWANGSTGLTGVVSAANSLVGTTVGEALEGFGFSVTAFSDGNYAVYNPTVANGTVANAGAVSLGSGSGGLIGPISATNSALGTTVNGGYSWVFAYDAARQHLIVGQPISNLVSILNGAGINAGGVNLNQHGLTGSWYDSATSGQGLEVEVYPDAVGSGEGIFFTGWFTYDVTAAGGRRWYAVLGNVSASNPVATLSIYTDTGGNLNAPPSLSDGPSLGQATITFSDCDTGTLTYQFTDGSGRSGTIPLSRLAPNVTCGPNGDTSAAASDYLLSGSWYNPQTSGQGLIFDINPSINNLFAAWYTFKPNGQQMGGGASQDWYTLYSNQFTRGMTSIQNVAIYQNSGGVFDSPPVTNSVQVGTAAITFQSCQAMTMTYDFTSGDNAGQHGTMNLTRVGPTPQGCNLP